MSEQQLIEYVTQSLGLEDTSHFSSLFSSTQNQTVSLVKRSNHPITQDESQYYVTLAFNAFALGLKVTQFMLIPMYVEIEISL